MKKMWLVFLFLFTFLSCEKQEVINDIDSDSGILTEDLENSLGFMKNLVPGESTTKTLTFSNDGGFDLSEFEISGIEAPLSYVGDIYPGEGGDCSDTIKVGQSCSIVLSIDLETETIRELSININYNNGVEYISKEIPVTVSILTNAELIVAAGEFSNTDELHSAVVSPIRFPKTKLGEVKTGLLSLGNSGRRSLKLLNTDITESKYQYTGGAFPGVNGTCNSEIKPLEICTVELSYEPSVVENITLPFHYEIYNGTDNQIIENTLGFEATDERANLTFSISTNYNFGEVVSGDKKIIEFLIFNNTVVKSSDMTFTFADPNVKFTGGAYPGLNGNCGLTIESFSFCKVEVEYTETVLGVHSTLFNIEYNDNNFFAPLTANSSITFNSTIVAPALFNLDVPTSANGHGQFGAVEVNTSQTHGVSIKNNGDFEGRIVGFEVISNPDNVFSISPGGSCGTTIQKLTPTRFCSINVKIVHNTVGAYSATLRVTYTSGSSIAADQVLDIPLNVNYSDTSDITFSGNTNFGTIPYPSAITRDRVYSFTNSKQGLANISFDTSFISGSDYSIVNSTCGTTLAYNATCNITVRYTPSNSGDDIKFIDMNVSDPLRSYSVRITLLGAARTHANLQIRNSSLTNLTAINFNNVEPMKSVEMFLNLRNAGGYTAQSINASLTGTAFSMEEVTCNDLSGMVLGGSGEECFFKLKFSPTATASYSETLTLSYFDGENPQSEVFVLTGDGAAAGVLEVQGALPVYDIGNVVIGEIGSLVLTLENTGSLPITNLTLTPSVNEFQWDSGANTCTGTINPAQTCSVKVDFIPSTGALLENFVFYTYDSNAQTYENFLFLTGKGQTPPNILVTQQGQGLISDHEFEDSPIGQQAYIKILVTNNGQAPAYNLTPAISGDSQFSITSLTCSNGATIEFTNTCEFYLIYLPTDVESNAGSFSVSFDNSPTQNISLTGNGVEPSAGFGKWTEIYAVSNDSSGNINIKWSPVEVSAGVSLTGYKVYESSSPLPADSASLAGFEVKDINSIFENDLVYSKSGYTPGAQTFITIRAKFPGGIIESSENIGHVKVIIPPPNMALVHPYIANQEFCKNMGLDPEKDKNFGCPYAGLGNLNGYYDFNKFLFVDRYETSEDGNGDQQSKAGETPQEYSNVIEASQKCSSATVSFGPQNLNKSLIRRSEFVAASAWNDLLTLTDITIFEDGGGENCAVNVDQPELTGSRDNCVSKYGIYDLPGNLWEWNSDLIENKFGGRSNVDITNDEMFGLHLANQLPGEFQTKDCFNFHFGLSQVSLGSCSNALTGGMAAPIIGDNYFWPPLVDDRKAIRSGGSIGPSANQSSREVGRWVADLNQSLLSNVPFTTARCVVRAPFSAN